MKTISLKTKQQNHPIHIGENVLNMLPNILSETKSGSKIAIVSNPTIWALHGETLLATLSESTYTIHSILIPDGESHKTLTTTQIILDALVEKRFERKDVILAFGGGVIGDIAGFAASIYLRGIPFIQIPTTLLAQVDAAIGGKTGVNHPSGKNLIGSFYQPICTLVELTFLDTLQKKDVLCGLAEVVKYGIIGNTGLFKYLETHSEKIATLQTKAHHRLWEYIIRWSCGDKAAIVSADEREAGLRENLNFGHTIGHGIESASKYTLYSHGEAVALGMKAAIWLAETGRLLDKKSAKRMLSLLKKLGFKTHLDPSVTVDAILEAMSTDKKIRNGKLRFILPTALGTVVTVNDVTLDDLRLAVEHLYA
jgi:3-dehydroquinate synthase